MNADPKQYPWTLWTREANQSKYTPEESFTTLEAAHKARDVYKAEAPTDMFKVLPTRSESSQIAMPYAFDLLYDLKSPERIIEAYREAMKNAKDLRDILQTELNGAKRNNGLVQSAKDIYGVETHNALVDMQKEFDKIDLTSNNPSTECVGIPPIH